MPLVDLKQSQSLTQYLILAQLQLFFKVALVVTPTFLLELFLERLLGGGGENLYIPSRGVQMEFLDEDNLYRPVLAELSFIYV